MDDVQSPAVLCATMSGDAASSNVLECPMPIRAAPAAVRATRSAWRGKLCAEAETVAPAGISCEEASATDAPSDESRNRCCTAGVAA